MIAAALDIFHPDPSHDALLAFSGSDWDATLAWLYRQRLSLYFAARLRSLGLHFLPPPSHRGALQMQQEANTSRIDAHFNRFIRINRSLTEADLTYANVLGFALIPFACPDPHLRFPTSIDLMLLASERDRCISLLRVLGHELETDEPYLRTFRNTHTPPTLRSGDDTLRLFLIPDDPSPDDLAPHNMLLRRREQSWSGLTFPAPSIAEHVISQALAIYGDTFEGTITVSALYEFTHAIRCFAHNTAFWSEIDSLSAEHPIRPQALGFASALSRQLFRTELPSSLSALTPFAEQEHIARFLSVTGLM